MRDFATTYLRIASFGMPSLLLMFAATGVAARAAGHPDPAVVAVAANLVNIGLNLLFVYGFDWGIAGSALGTLVAQGARRGRAGPRRPARRSPVRRLGPATRAGRRGGVARRECH